MYICVKTNDEMEELFQDLLKLNVKVELSRHDTLSWIDADFTGTNLLAYACLQSNVLVVHTKGTDTEKPKRVIEFPLYNVVTIYELA